MRDLIDVLRKTKYKKSSTVYVSIVGAGGKTTLLYLLGNHLQEAGFKVLLTTTTMVYYPDSDENINNLTFWGSKIIEIEYKQGFEQDKRKIKGFDKEEMECFVENGQFNDFDFVLIEADGAKRMPIKAPNENEPVVISFSDIVIGVVGLDSLGKAINEENTHRPAELIKVFNKDFGDIIIENDIKNLVLSENGLFKNSPVLAKKVLVLNKADTAEMIKSGEKIIDLLMNGLNGYSNSMVSNFKIDYLMISSLEKGKTHKVVNMCPEIMPKISIVVFAAGEGIRMGVEKLLLEIDGISILDRVLNSVMQIKTSEDKTETKSKEITETILVYSADRVKEIAEKHKIANIIKNHEPERGMSSSLKLAVEKTAPDSDAFMFFMGDQPFISKKTVEKLIGKWLEDNSRIVVPCFAGKKGNPVIFPSSFRKQLLEVTGDKGGREIISLNFDKINFVEIEESIEGHDIDDPATYEKYKGGLL